MDDYLTEKDEHGSKASDVVEDSSDHSVFVPLEFSAGGGETRVLTDPEEIKEIAWKAQIRLSRRYSRLASAGKDQRKIVTAVGRELLGFIWAIGVKAETAAKQRMAA